MEQLEAIKKILPLLIADKAVKDQQKSQRKLINYS